MKQSLHKLLLTTLLACATISAAAYDFEVDGFYYTKLSDSTVKLTCNQYDKSSYDFYYSSTMTKYSGAVTIPYSVSDGTSSYQVVAIDEGVFYGCEDLVSVKIPEGVTSIGGGTFFGCSALTSINIPDNVTSIGSYAFRYCSSLISITIPDGVTSIEEYTFDKCSGLTSITIPDGVTSIGMCAFYGCSGLTSITIPNEVTQIGRNAFQECRGLTSINIPEGVTTIEKYTFQLCSSLTSITIPNGVTSIGNYAFASCSSLTSITIPNGVTSIGNYAFQGCSGLTSITISNGVTSIENFTFDECNKLKSINISSVEQWMKINSDYNRFGLSNYNLIVNGLKLTDLVIPDDITTIGKYTFYGCTSLKSITFHKDVTTIVQNAFNGCLNVKKIICQGDTPPVCGANALTKISRSECTLYVPETSGTSYKNTSPWSEFTNIVGGGTETPDTPKTCDAPSITFDNTTKQLKFESATSGAKYHCTIKSDDMMTDKSNDGTAQMTGVYDITAYASADGMYNSDKVTAKLVWVNAEINTDVDVISAKTQRGVIVSTDGESIRISGTLGGETINVYNAAGSLMKSVKAQGDNTEVNGLSRSNVYVVKIGGTSVKVAM